MRAGLALLLLLSTMLGGNCQDTDSPQCELAPSVMATKRKLHILALLQVGTLSQDSYLVLYRS